MGPWVSGGRFRALCAAPASHRAAGSAPITRTTQRRTLPAVKGRDAPAGGRGLSMPGATLRPPHHVEDGEAELENIVGLIASAATMIAAMMTAANLGARVTGWGFVVFFAGSVCWSAVGLMTSQADLAATNLFLMLVNLAGIWRWLGRQSAYEKGGRTATRASRRSVAPSLFTATGIAGMAVRDRHGVPLGKVVEALIECTSGGIAYVVVASGGMGGIDERLRAVPRTHLAFDGDRLTLRMGRAGFERLPVLEDGDWPARASLPDEEP